MIKTRQQPEGFRFRQQNLKGKKIKSQDNPGLPCTAFVYSPLNVNDVPCISVTVTYSQVSLFRGGWQVIPPSISCELFHPNLLSIV